MEIKFNLSKNIGTLASLASVITCVFLAFNVYTDIKNRLDKVLEHDEEFHEVEQRFKALECYLEVVNCQGVFATINGPEAVMVPSLPLPLEELDSNENYRGAPLTTEQRAYQGLIEAIPMKKIEDENG